MEKKKIAFLLSHPIQYFSPLLQELAKEPNLVVKAYYCSNHGVAEKIDKEFGKVVKWDIPLLDGYDYHFLENSSKNPSVTDFWGLINWDIVKQLRQDKPEILIVHGWGYFTHWFTIIVASFLGIKVWLRGETPLKQELGNSNHNSFKKRLRKFILKHILFSRVDKFLYIGLENKKFYQYFGVVDKQLIFTPYCIDNQRFDIAYQAIKKDKFTLRNQLSISPEKVVFLFCGKLIDKKQPLLLLEAYKNMKQVNRALIIVGDGELRETMKEYITRHQLQDVYCVGFKNQTELPQYYTMADIFVLPSSFGETWGLVTNEAMNFALPLLISDMVGCVEDLVIENQNGFAFKHKNAKDLQEKMDFMVSNVSFREKAGQKSKELIATYSIRTIVQNLTKEAISV